MVNISIAGEKSIDRVSIEYTKIKYNKQGIIHL